MGFALCLAVAGCATVPTASNPCDLLVAQNPKPETSTYLVASDRPFARAVAKHRGRYDKYRCGK